MDKYLKLTNQRGQGLIEVLVSVSIIVLILAGVVPLMLTSLASKSKTFQRKKALELAQIKIEETINLEKNNSEFWTTIVTANNESEVDASGEGFAGYKYSRIYTRDDSVPCVAAPAEMSCVNANIKVWWNNDSTKFVSFSRFFAKN